MNILELDSFNLADAVKFNDELNPRIWDGNKMRPEVREKLLAIAADFQESLGVSGLDVEDITVSGSNAGYTYTPHSDIDLHLVVRMPDECDDVYQELFNAKKYQYNDEHDIRIGGYDVELYVQPADQPHVSAGVYSVAKDDWIHIPRKIAARVDDESVRNKYEDVKARIDSALKSNDADRMRKLWDKIKDMRRSGLAQNGELGAENLAFKILRTQGDLGRLKDAIARARDAELSLTERGKKKKKSRVKYGFGGYWYPGFAFGSGESGEGGGGDGGGGESRVGEDVTLTPDGVSASTRMFLSEKPVPSHTEIIFDFMRFAVHELGLKNVPVLKIKKDPQWSAIHKSFGRYRNDLGQIELAVGNRHIMDVLRTLAHELQHRKQDEREHMPDDAGETGSRFENEAHAVAGVLMRNYAEMHPEYFEDVPMAESASGYIPKNKKEAQDPRYAMAVTQDIKPGQTGKEANKMALKTDAQGRPGLLMKTVNLREGRAYDANEPIGPETPPTMPAGTVRVDVSDVYDWYKLGQHISNMKGLGKHDFGSGPPSSIISFGDEETEHKFIKDLEATGLDVTDIDPKDPTQPPGMRKIKTDPTYNVDESLVYENTGTEPVIFLNPNTAIVGQGHGKPLTLQPQTLKRIQDIAANHGAWYEGNGADRVYTKGQIDQYRGSWDDLVAKTASPNDPKWLYVLFSNVDENNRVQRVGVDPNDTIFNRLLATAKDNSFQGIGFTAQALQKFLTMASEGNVDFVQMSQQPATQQNLTRFLKAGEALMWPANWSQYPHRAGKIAKAATVDVRDQFLASRKAGVYVVGSGHLLAVQNLVSVNEGKVYNIALDQLIDVFYNPSNIDRRVDSVKIATIPYKNLDRLVALLRQKHQIEPTQIAWRPVKNKQSDPTESDLVESLRREFAMMEDEMLGEIRMSTASLRQEAAKTGALAGMEFEMIVPDVSGIDIEPEYERDDDRDQRSRDFSEVEDFFFDGDYNGRGDIRRLMDALNEAYQEWKMDQISDDWINDGLDYIREYIERYDLFDRDEALDTARDEIITANPDLPTDSEEFKQLVSARINELEEQFIQDEFETQDRIYNDAFTEFTEDKNDDYDEGEFLRENYPYMSDIEREFNITWPYYYDINADAEGEADVDEVADSFSSAIGRPVNASRDYHGATREAGKYVVEPDGSLDPDNSNDAGLEFVSPPLPIDELLSDLNKVKQWASSRGCYTNNSTGLHINISVPGYSLDKLDYVKLALMMGDEYVLEEFGRMSNTYTKAATGKIRDALKRNPDLAPAIMDKMRGHMEELATKAIHSGATDKYTSINTKNGYIEFRSPGGDWLDDNFDKIENTLLRFTVAMDAALNPEKYRKEYLKKLYKLLESTQNKEDVDVLQLFANYSTGELDKAALIQQVREKQLARNLAKGKVPAGQKYWWSVGRPGYFASVEVVAQSKEEAIEKGLAEYPDWRGARDITAKPLRPYQEPGPVRANVGEPQPIGQQGNWGIWIRSANRFARAPGQTDNSVLRRFPGPDSALQWIERARRENPNMRTDIEVREIEPAAAAQPQQGSGAYTFRVYDAFDNQTLGTFQANGIQGSTNANIAFRNYLLSIGRDSAAGLWYEEIGRERSTTPAASQDNWSQDFERRMQGADPGSLIDQGIAASGSFTGNWLIQDENGRTIHRFGGIGNSQGDANNFAIRWLQQNPRHMQAGVTVVPEMG